MSKVQVSSGLRPGERCVVAGSGAGKILEFVGGCMTNGRSGVVFGTGWIPPRLCSSVLVPLL